MAHLLTYMTTPEAWQLEKVTLPRCGEAGLGPYRTHRFRHPLLWQPRRFRSAKRIQVDRRRTSDCREHYRKRKSRDPMEARNPKRGKSSGSAISQISVGKF